MTTRAMRWTLGAALACAMLAASGGAQTQDDICEWVAWKGDARIQDAAVVVRERRDELAEMRVHAMSGRFAELGEWEARVGDIRRFATSARPIPDQAALLADLAVTRVQLYATQGRFAEARAALDALLFTEEDPEVLAEPDAFTTAPPALLAIAAQAARDPRIAEHRVDLSLTVGVAEPTRDDLDAQLEEAIAKGDWRLIQEIGSRALPALEAAVLADAGGFPEVLQDDPLYYMVLISPQYAASMALEHLGSAGFAFRRRVLRAMDRAKVLGWENWGEQPSPLEPRPCLVPEWPLVVAILLGDPLLAREAMPALEQMLRANGVTPEVTAAVRAALSTSPELVSGVMQAFAEAQRMIQQGRIESAKGLYEVMLASPQADVRRYAASELLGFASNHALWTHAEDPDALVREAVADSLRPRQILVRREGVPSLGRVQETIDPRIDEHALAALRTLLRDENPSVRESAARSLTHLDQPLEPELYRALLDDPSPRVRALLAFVSHPDDALLRGVLERLVADPSREVREGVDARLHDPALWRRESVALPIARARLLQGEHSTDDRIELIDRMAPSDRGLAALIEAILSSSDDTLRRDVFGNVGDFRSSTGREWHALAALDEKTLFELLLRLGREDEERFQQVLGITRKVTPPLWRIALRVAESDALSASARLHAAMHAAPGGGERLRATVIQLLSTGELAERELADAETKHLHELLGTLPELDRNPLVLAALSADGIPDPVRARVASSYTPHAPGGREITLGVLARWLDGNAPAAAEVPVSTALYHLVSLPDDLDPARLERAVRHPLHAASALEAIATLQDPRYLPVVRAALNPTWVPERRRNEVVHTAFDVLGNSPTDEATGILLEEMVASPNSWVRGACATVLDQRRAMLERRNAWERAAEARLDEVDAVTRLAALLKDDDPAIRAQAARGLATLQAVQALPLLIEALRDGDAEVRAAVTAALDRLNAPAEPAGRKE